MKLQEISAVLLGWVEDFRWEGECHRGVRGRGSPQPLRLPGCHGARGTPVTRARILYIVTWGGVTTGHLANGRARTPPLICMPAGINWGAGVSRSTEASGQRGGKAELWHLRRKERGGPSAGRRTQRGGKTQRGRGLQHKRSLSKAGKPLRQVKRRPAKKQRKSTLLKRARRTSAKATWLLFHRKGLVVMAYGQGLTKSKRPRDILASSLKQAKAALQRMQAKAMCWDLDSTSVLSRNRR